MELNELLPSGPESVAAALARDQQHVSRLEKKAVREKILLIRIWFVTQSLCLR